ncbi:MAG: FdhD protein [Acidimicrobiia bacterium]|nr:FdhD protein [Acidimicrobiia bacterium]
MPRGRTKRVLIGRREDGAMRRIPDQLIVEEPLEIRLDGHRVGTTMRTPGADFELAVGLCFADGLLAGASVQQVRYCATGSAVDTEFNIVTVETGGTAPVPEARVGTITSSCGLCGSTTLFELASRLAPLGDVMRFAPEVIEHVADTVLSQQTLFGVTGGVHAAAAFDAAGAVSLVREDIGRHNAVDKVVGTMLLQGRLPARQLGLFVSGRASFELVQKAWAAGFSALVAVSAPSSLAVEAAERAGLLLVGFARPGRLNVYAGSLA